MIVLDFETGPIQPRPLYPPVPVGLAVSIPGQPSRYYAWGHPEGNNCEESDARELLAKLWASDEELCFFNAKFDLDVAQTHMGVGDIAWQRVHDPMFLAFLADPHSPSFALKPLAERYLGLPPDEQDAVRDWLVEHRVCAKGLKGWGAHIAQAPGSLVGSYAIGDVDRTRALFQKLKNWTGVAYDRERKLMPILLENERAGIRLDRRRLARNVARYEDALLVCDEWLRNMLGKPGLNIDSDRELADALDSAGYVRDWHLTPTGQRSTAKDKLTKDLFSEPEIFLVLNYRNRLTTALNTFMLPWLAQAALTGGRVHTNWNQIRSFGQGKDFAGARTGRLSSNPNFQNLPKQFRYEHPNVLSDLPRLPLLRSYFLPDEGCAWVHRDYSQQEYRILAHFEAAGLMAQFQADPRTDIHRFVGGEIRRLRGLELDRGRVKTLNFGLLYGMGLAKLATSLGCTEAEAAEIKSAQRAAIPGLADLERQIRAEAAVNSPIVTWGGREYLPEPPKDGRTFEYKLLNYLIQGSAADCTKEALCRYDAAKRYGTLLCTVHDEINISVPVDKVDTEMRILKNQMGSVEFDVPMLSEGKSGPNWGDLKEWKDA